MDPPDVKRMTRHDESFWVIFKKYSELQLIFNHKCAHKIKMCRITQLPAIQEQENIDPNRMIFQPAVVGYQYPPGAPVHPYTNTAIDDHLFCFKTLFEHEPNEPVYIVKVNGSCYGFKESTTCDLIVDWYDHGLLNETERDEMLQYFITWFHSGWCCIRDCITSSTRTFHWCPLNWLMYYVGRVDLRGMVPPEWADAKEEDAMRELDRRGRAQIPAVVRANSPVTATNDIFELTLSDLDGETIGSIDTWSIHDNSDPNFNWDLSDDSDIEW